jgi:hypothetical protein
MTRIVTTTYRYKPLPRKRKAVPLAGPAIVTPKRKRVLPPIEEKKFEPAAAIVRKAKPCNDNRPEAETERLPTIVTARRKAAKILPPGLLPDTPEEHRRRAEAADALFRNLMRRVAAERS